MGTKYVLPGVGGQISSDDGSPTQQSPLLHYYSPRLFGAPPQLTNQCDMRIMSSDGVNPGPVGDYYLTKILQDSNIANFVVGRARFIGGMSSFSNVIREIFYYSNALSKYDILDENGDSIKGSDKTIETVDTAELKERYKKAYGERDSESMTLASAGSLGLDDIDEDVSVLAGLSSESESMLSNMESMLKVSGLVGSLRTSLSVQQPFYTFEDDWFTYINNVKMMINTAVIMLGLQKSCVRIGDDYYPLKMSVQVDGEGNNDVWANYRYITPTDNLGSVTAINTDNGENSQYVSFMIDPASINESYTNDIGVSEIYSTVIDSGSNIGSEMAFITNSTSSPSDTLINIAKGSKTAADNVLKSLSSGSGRFTAAIANSMARSFIGDHTIYPEIFKSHRSTTSMSVTTHLTASSGDPYAYLTDILVPLFFILGMAIPQLSSNNASAYTYPPVIQCNIPGMWGTRLGMVESVTINKNPHGKDVSINGYPLHIDVTIQIRDLQHVLMTSPMNRVSTFLNNHTMFDYIAQISGVDKYRINGSMRTVARLALTVSALSNSFKNVGDALLTDWHSLVNKTFGYDRQ